MVFTTKVGNLCKISSTSRIWALFFFFFGKGPKVIRYSPDHSSQARCVTPSLFHWQVNKQKPSTVDSKRDIWNVDVNSHYEVQRAVTVEQAIVELKIKTNPTGDIRTLGVYLNRLSGTFLKIKDALTSSGAPKGPEDHAHQLWWTTEQFSLWSKPL